MADNVTVSNTPTSSNTDIPVRTSETASGKQIQHIRIDLGTGSAEEVQEGSLLVREKTVNSASLSSVVSSATSVQLLNSNTSRRGAIFVNLADKACFLKFGQTASATSFTYKIPAQGTLEMPRPVFTGHIHAIWETSPTGSIYITEL